MDNKNQISWIIEWMTVVKAVKTVEVYVTRMLTTLTHVKMTFPVKSKRCVSLSQNYWRQLIKYVLIRKVDTEIEISFKSLK